MNKNRKIASFLRDLIRHHGAGNNTGRSGDDSAYGVLRHTLMQMQCKYEEKDYDENRVIFVFDYQDGRFSVLVPKNQSHFATIFFSGVMLVQEDGLPSLRSACNIINGTPSNVKAYYVYDETANEYRATLLAGIYLAGSIDSPQEYLAATLKAFFFYRRNLFDIYTEKCKDAEKVGVMDVEVVRNYEQREAHLLLEAEMKHDMDSISDKEAFSADLRLVPILEELLELNGICPRLLTVMRQDGTVTTITDEKQLAGYNPMYAVVDGEGADAAFAADMATVTLTFTETGLACERTAVIHIKAEQCSDFVLYARMSVMLVPLPASKTCVADTGDNSVLCKSVIVAYDKKSQQQRRQEFCYMYDDARDKVARGDTAALTDEQRLIADTVNLSLGHEVYWAHKYVRERRYYEAAQHLKNVYRSFCGQDDNLPERLREVFYDAIFTLGCCYNAMGCYEKAFFYLDFLFPLNRILFMKEYVNCLVNSNDFRAAKLVDEIIGRVSALEKEHEEAGEEIDEGFREFHNFLRRRQVYVMINNGKYEQATKLLNKMILEPGNTDFALNELACIQKKEEKGK